ncbi:MAG: TauD/TfdA family dioxygenase [Alphaproteobacteria bacterium]|jgi:hypothetical protein|nr:TauD/TfdA family dioxygenase [Alphaproteobacteria bacterium]
MATMLETPLSGPKAWVTETPVANDGIMRLSDECRAELEAAARVLEANPLPTEALAPDDLDLAAPAACMASVRRTLDDGVGFAIIDRIDLDRIGVEAAIKLYWVLMSMLGRPVAQKWDGDLLYDIIDTGQKTGAGTGVRASKTNVGQDYHTDNSFNLAPDFVALLCIRPAMQGGTSGLISFESVHNLLLAEYPEVLKRLYQPFYFDRQMEHAPGDERVSSKPVFVYDGKRLEANLAPWQVRQGYAVAGVEIDPATETALATLEEVMERPDLGKTLEFEPGQIQIVDNRQLGHRRTAYQDWPEAEKRRRLVRIWLRQEGRAFYLG